MGTGSERPEASATQSAVADPRFRRLLGAKLCVDIAEYALAYALLITIVRRTGSGIHSTLLVMAYTVPAIFFGIPAGQSPTVCPNARSLSPRSSFGSLSSSCSIG